MTLNEEHFNTVLKLAYHQVFEGKGIQRHGMDTPFHEQPWKVITDNVGTGFCLGQAMKKLMELRALSDHSAWEREALGAIVYIVMAIMYRQHASEKEHPF